MTPPSAPIVYDSAHQRFVLQGDTMTYAFRLREGELLHDYWGASANVPEKPRDPPRVHGWRSWRSVVPWEFPDFGTGDFRSPAWRAVDAGAHPVQNLRYVSHAIVNGKPPMDGLPATFGTDKDVMTLTVTLRDPHSGLQAVLFYSVFPHHDALCRHVEFTNTGKAPVTLTEAHSFTVDLPSGDYDMLQLSGDWARERLPVRRPVVPGVQSIGSVAGFSGHEHNPFVALLARDAKETHGDAYGFNFVYSGSFSATVEQNPAHSVRVGMGLNPRHFTWTLAPGESFVTPEVVAVYAADGLGAMSRRYHDLYRAHLVRSAWQTRPRPVLINNWEATHFTFTEERIVRLAKKARELGVSLMVLDDGWFGERHPRNDEKAGLGDWFANPAKLPHGVDGLARTIDASGMQFGLWIEPEMVNAASDLYTAHPDWVLHNGAYERTEQRFQLVLDLSRRDVQDHLIDTMTTLLKSAPIAFVKWDHNRGMHEVDSLRTPHAYMLGLYRVMDTLTARFPQILFEGCASGGGRFDAGTLHYLPQTWVSDNTDGADRLRIQMGTSIVYPMSSADGHVSAVPNHQTGRTTAFAFRAHVAMMCGAFGFELDPDALTPAEQQQVPAFIALYEEIQPLILAGDMHRLADAQTSNWPAVSYVSKDKSRAAVLAFQMQQQVNVQVPPLRLAGLDPRARYRIEELDMEITGETLMHRGITLDFWGDYASQLLRLTRLPTT